MLCTSPCSSFFFCPIVCSKGSAVDAVCRLGRTALSLAAESGHAAACRALVENGAEVNKTDSSTEQYVA